MSYRIVVKMIPKIIHYCWFGRNPLPELAQRCIASWRKYLPDYEVWQWSEETLNANDNPRSATTGDACRAKRGKNVNDECLFDKRVEFDVNMIPYTAEAYRKGKYAFVSDYARFWILYKYGGLYFDTDVEVICPMDDIIVKGAFMGFETDPDGENSPLKYPPRYAYSVAVGLGCGFEPENEFVRKMMDIYGSIEFVEADKSMKISLKYKNIVAYTMDVLMANGLQDRHGIQELMGITIYPSEYFAPINVVSGRLHITSNTRSIHRYTGTWVTPGKKTIKDYVQRILPEWVLLVINRIKRRKNRLK